MSRLHRSFLRSLVLLFIFVPSMVACSGNGEITVSSPTARLLSSPTNTFPPKPTTTNPPQSTSTSVPTSLPADTFSIEVESWPETGDLIMPFEGEVTFGTHIADLIPGDYLVVVDSAQNAVNYVSIDTGGAGLLLQMDESLELPNRVIAGKNVFLLGYRANPWVIYNLISRESWIIGPFCIPSSTEISPDGKWIDVSCSIRHTRGIYPDQVVHEIISVAEGKGFRLAIPSEAENQTTLWFDTNKLIGSDIITPEGIGTCVISFLDGILFCPSIVEPSYRLAVVSGVGGFIPLTDSRRDPWRAVIVPRECFIQNEVCPDHVDLGDVDGFVLALPGNDKVGWVSGIDRDETTGFGYFQAPTWEFNLLAQFNEIYRIDSWCPDESCMILYKEQTFEQTFSRQQLDLDGTLTPLPYEKVIGSFSIP